MKKRYLLLILILPVLGFSQQTLKRVNGTDFSFLCLANGNSLGNTCGPNNFAENFSVYDLAVHYPVSVTRMFSSNLNVGIPDETIGNTNFNWLNPGKEYTVSVWSNPNSLQFLCRYVWADCNNDGNKDALLLTVDLPTAYENGAAIPVGTKIILNTDNLYDFNTGQVLLPYLQQWLGWDGTGWFEYVISPITGVPLPVLTDWVAILDTPAFTAENHSSVYPNPSKDFISITNALHATTELQYHIIDLNGRIIQEGKTQFNTKINIEKLVSGCYIIFFKGENGEYTSKKLIKT